MASLVIVEGAGSGKSVPLERALVLGREKADVIVADIAASREHCKVFSQDGDWFVLDLNSRNGTKVNGERISRWHLAPGDTITIGKTSIRFDAPELPPRAAEPKPAPAASRPAAAPAAPRGPSAVERERERLRAEAADRRAAAPAASSSAPQADDGSGIVIRETVLQYGRIADRGGLLSDDVAQRGGIFKVALVLLCAGFLVGVVWGVMKMIEKDVVETPDAPPDAPPPAPPPPAK